MHRTSTIIRTRRKVRPGRLKARFRAPFESIAAGEGAINQLWQVDHRFRGSKMASGTSLNANSGGSGNFISGEQNANG